MSTVAHRTWIVTEFYHPDENATGYLMTNLARGMCRTRTVGVVCRNPKSVHSEESTQSLSVCEPVVHRMWSTHFSKDILLLRFVNILTLTSSIFVSLLRRLRQGDAVLVVTNPPTIPYVTKVAAAIKRAACIVLVYDVYPEVVVATGLMRQTHPIVSLLHWMTSRLFASANAVVVLGRDMRNLITQRYNGGAAKLRIITNWVNVDEIKPALRSDNKILKELNLTEKFVVGYVGNIGRTHDIETIAEAGRLLAGSADIHFLFIGEGAKKPWLERFISHHNLRNFTVLPFQDRTRQSDVHNSCDLSVISLVPGMAGLSVPSRMYNMMSAGKPILAITDQESELALVVEEENIGWVVAAATPDKIARCILLARKSQDVLSEMGNRARIAAIEKYSFEHSLRQYEDLMNEIQRGTECKRP